MANHKKYSNDQIKDLEFIISRGFSYLAIFLIPFYFFRFEIIGVPTNIFEIAVLISVLPIIFELLIHKKQPQAGSLWPYLLVFVAGFSVFFADDTRVALGIFKGWFLIPAVFYLVIINTFRKNEIKRLAYPIYISLIIVAFWAVFQKLGLISTLFYQSGDSSFGEYLAQNARVFGPFESPNYLAMYIVPAMFLALPILQSAKLKASKIIYLIGYLLPLAALWFSGSRAGIIAFLISIIIFSIVYINRKFNVSNLLLVVLTILSIGALIYYFVVIQFNPNSDTVRIEIYHYSIELIRSNWLWGVGLGGFKEAIISITQNATSFKTHALPYALHPHNVFFAYWLNTGIFGLLVLVANIVKFFWEIYKDRKRSLLFAAALMAMIAIVIHGLFDTTYFKNDLAAMFWLLLALRFLMTDEKVT